MKKKLTLEDELYFVGVCFFVFAVICAYVFLKFILPIMPEVPCFFWKVFGAYCPGCGGTRALINMLQGRFLKSLWYHPLIMYCVVVYGWFMISHTLRKLHIIKNGMKYRDGYMYGALAVIAINFVLKNVLKFCFGIVMV